MLMEYPENHLLMSRMAGLWLVKSSLILFLSVHMTAE